MTNLPVDRHLLAQEIRASAKEFNRLVLFAASEGVNVDAILHDVAHPSGQTLPVLQVAVEGLGSDRTKPLTRRHLSQSARGAFS